MCNYSITNKVFISEKGPRRSFDTGPTQNYLRQCVETSHGLRSWRHPHATKNLAFESWRFVMCSPSVWKFEEWDASSGLVIGRIFCLLVFLQNVTSIRNESIQQWKTNENSKNYSINCSTKENI
ncbi:hypothetical protein TNCV_4415821 [Trichonephila clavipes]|uniref:Uncharacterized protein n=1 Tax=Trichonephila clavipes TaxID=2585209 RepID=A0A8X6S161_TRICX|nr:hypothetical protein TNCV_4415821 [Trichonephila clavipes]